MARTTKQNDINALQAQLIECNKDRDALRKKVEHLNGCIDDLLEELTEVECMGGLAKLLREHGR